MWNQSAEKPRFSLTWNYSFIRKRPIILVTQNNVLFFGFLLTLEYIMKCKCPLPTMVPTVYLENISYYVKYPWTTFTKWEVQNDRGLPNPAKWVYIKEEIVLVFFLWYASVCLVCTYTKLKIPSTKFSRTTESTRIENTISCSVTWYAIPVSFPFVLHTVGNKHQWFKNLSSLLLLFLAILKVKPHCQQLSIFPAQSHGSTDPVAPFMNQLGPRKVNWCLSEKSSAYAIC